MCMQCMAGAMTAGAAATGMRAWLASRRPNWMTAARLKVSTAAILALAVVAAGSHLTPAGSAPAAGDRSASSVSTR